MLHALIAWGADGGVVATLNYLVAQGDDGSVIGLVDFEAHESAGGRLRDVWENSAAVGSGTWPEWLGGSAHDFKVELHDSPARARARIVALVHKKSGHRRDRAPIEAEIASRVEAVQAESRKQGEALRAHMRERGHPDPDSIPDPVRPADLRDLVGGPNRPLRLDEHGRNLPWEPMSASQTMLPVVRARQNG